MELNLFTELIDATLNKVSSCSENIYERASWLDGRTLEEIMRDDLRPQYISLRDFGGKSDAE